jgi:hypothetical protein
LTAFHTVVSPYRFLRQKCSDTPCGCQAPPQTSNWTDLLVCIEKCFFFYIQIVQKGG